MRRRRFVRGECNHVYQRTVEGVNIFYDREDFLVCFMVFSTIARKHKVRVLEMCLMVDHIHILVEAESCEALASFIRDYSSVFAQEYNRYMKRTGQLFHKSFGSAPKKGDKKTRSAIVYIGNNPVEKKLCVYPEEYRWNFMAYMGNTHPYSEKPDFRNMSRPLKRALGVVKAASESNRYLSYCSLVRFMKPLRGNELEYFTDYVISSYLPFDKDALLEYYEDFDQMLLAMKSSTGSDYDIRERFYPGSDQIYFRMTAMIEEKLNISPVRTVTVMRQSEKLKLASELRKMMPEVTEYHLKKFLHLKKGDAYGLDNKDFRG